MKFISSPTVFRRVLAIQICIPKAFLLIAFSTQVATAEPSCEHTTFKKKYTVSEYMEQSFISRSSDLDYWLNIAGVVPYSPIEEANSFVSIGCQDKAFFASLLQAMSDALVALPIPDDYYYSRRHLGAAHEAIASPAVEMYMLGYPEPLNLLLARLREMRDAGDPRAASALAYLGIPPPGGIYNSLAYFAEKAALELYRARRLIAVVPALQDHPKYAIEEGYFGSKKVKVTDPDLLALQNELIQNQDRNRDLAVAGGSVGASILQLASDGFADGLPRSICPSPDNNFNYEEVRERYAQFDDPKRIVTNMITIVSDFAQAERKEHNALTAQSVALIAAQLASDCAFGPFAVRDSYGIKDMALARQAVRAGLLVSTKAAFVNREMALAVALDIETGPDFDMKHVAAARFLLLGNPYWTDFSGERAYDAIVPRLSRETIREAQKLLADAGLYNSGIDGVAGRGFKQGMRKLELCPPDLYPNICKPDDGTGILATDWGKAYVNASVQ